MEMKLLLIESGQEMGKKFSRVMRKRGNDEKVKIAKTLSQAKSDYEMESFDAVIMDLSSPEITKEEIDMIIKYKVFTSSKSAIC